MGPTARIAPAAPGKKGLAQHSTGSSRTATLAWAADGVLLTAAVGTALLLRALSRRTTSV
ncbi:hypothetical protein [Streptomyces sp. BK340]|uniref:hypothetical protein n=1 Tax=Streptomyces sp. BK340 TaxID=2572903 RepID=UPI0011A684DB|nr:hypothetical protein [Streptomyces sp. BK340]TVZ90493.1 hypothetical protein FB157_111151 [Streptomyces sp. BK340]